MTEKQWKEFWLSGDNGIFNLEATASGIDGNKLISEEGRIPYISRSNNTNGIKSFVSEQQSPKYKMDDGNCISIGLDTQTVFYQSHKFFTGQNIQILRNNILNENKALFLIQTILSQMVKFNWGGNGATLGRLKRTKILLPVRNNGQPDYDYMESIVKGIKKKKIQKYQNYICGEKEKLSFKEIPKIDVMEWKAFHVKNIFSSIQRGKRLTKKNQISGNTPYISSSATENGVDNFIGNTKSIRKFSNCLSLANSGSVGSCFYEPFEFIASDHVTHLKEKSFTKFQYLFMATMLRRLSEKYNFNREINDDRISTETIMLPIDSKGNPDYEYMEQYIKNLMLRKYQDYLSFKE